MTVPSEDNIVERLALIDQLKSFLVSAPNGQQEAIKQHVLSTSGESITCVKWNDAFYISGTDIVRCLVFRFHAFGRPIQNLKKFEEGVFSDLRNLKPGTDAILEEPKSAFLDLLFKNNCIRTQKKQKVFFWYSVPHDRLFLDALERDLKREKLGIYPTSVSVAHPATTISLDTTQAMFDNFRKSMLSEMNLDPFYLHREHSSYSDTSSNTSIISDSPPPLPVAAAVSSREGDLQKASSAIFGQFSLFEGSPTYKQRRRRVTQQRIQQQQQTLVDYNRKKLSTTTTNNNNNNFPDTTLNIWHSDASTTSSNTNTDDDSSSVRFFNCPLSACGKHFKRLEHMKRHLRTHTMERPYLCDLCGKRFSRSDNLAQHKKTHQRIRMPKHGHHPHEGSDGDDQPSSSSDSTNCQFKPRRTSSTNKSRPVKQHSSATKRSNNMQNNTSSRRCHLKAHAEVIYESDWSHPPPTVEYLKVKPVYPQLVVPELSISTTSAASSCDSSPIYTTRPPTIKIEDTEIFYDLSSTSQPLNDTTMMMVEELLPQQTPYWEDESASDWQRRVDWDQYCVPQPRPYEDLSINQFYHPQLPTNYLHQAYFVDHSTVTTAANSPILGDASEFYPPHYFSESPTMTPNDALLQH
ncbi:hypothetical protein HPULCUR_005518 [Helicostylum pulchrum]|uniref:C2H2-type domain-containing protein n=1 Tax=Helicostylum pulchrum TaxID=562976 RepID=A0ABP9XZE8_9FUNG